MRNKKALVWWSLICMTVYGRFEKWSGAHSPTPSRHSPEYHKKSWSFSKSQHQLCSAWWLEMGRWNPLSSSQLQLCLHSTQLFVLIAATLQIWCFTTTWLGAPVKNLDLPALAPKAPRTGMAPCPKDTAREPQCSRYSPALLRYVIRTPGQSFKSCSSNKSWHQLLLSCCNVRRTNRSIYVPNMQKLPPPPHWARARAAACLKQAKYKKTGRLNRSEGNDQRNTTWFLRMPSPCLDTVTAKGLKIARKRKSSTSVFSSNLQVWADCCSRNTLRGIRRDQLVHCQIHIFKNTENKHAVSFCSSPVNCWILDEDIPTTANGICKVRLHQLMMMWHQIRRVTGSFKSPKAWPHNSTL